jgi:hypothetical protein
MPFLFSMVWAVIQYLRKATMRSIGLAADLFDPDFLPLKVIFIRTFRVGIVL